MTFSTFLVEIAPNARKTGWIFNILSGRSTPRTQLACLGAFCTCRSQPLYDFCPSQVGRFDFNVYCNTWVGMCHTGCIMGDIPVTFMDVIMGDIPVTSFTIYNLTTLFERDTFMCWFYGCYHGRYTGYFHVLISWMLSWENIPVTFMCWFHGCYHGRYTSYFHVLISWMLSWEIYQLLSCVAFMDVIMGCISMSKEEGPWLNLTLHCLTLCVYPLTKGRTKSL